MCMSASDGLHRGEHHSRLGEGIDPYAWSNVTCGQHHLCWSLPPMATTFKPGISDVTSDSFTSRNFKLNFYLTGITSDLALIVQLCSRKIIDLWHKLTAVHSGIHCVVGKGWLWCKCIIDSPGSYTNSCFMMFIFPSHLSFLRISLTLIPRLVYVYTCDLRMIIMAISTPWSAISHMC